MKIYNMICVLMVMNVCGCEIWNTQIRLTDWHFRLVRKQKKDPSIIESSLEAITLLDCAFQCSFRLAEWGVSLYYDNHLNQCYCNLEVDTTQEDETEDSVWYGQLKSLFEIEEEILDTYTNTRTTVWPYRSECKDLIIDGYQEDGIYSIIPVDNYRLFAYCDMTAGGWTVIQRRMNGSENFYRNWDDYRDGFGRRTWEYWIGLETIHRLTKSGLSELSVYAETYPGVDPAYIIANYTQFYVGDASSKYVLHSGGFSGNCGDSIAIVDGRPFSTYDNDNDLCGSESCARKYKGAEWYECCFQSSLNGVYYQEGEYSPDGSVLYASGIQWHTCWGSYKHSLKSTILKVRAKSS